MMMGDMGLVGLQVVQQVLPLLVLTAPEKFSVYIPVAAELQITLLTMRGEL